MKEKLMERLKEKAEEGRITCALAWRIADELGVSKEEVGRAADDLGIRIKDCRLGCF